MNSQKDPRSVQGPCFHRTRSDGKGEFCISRKSYILSFCIISNMNMWNLSKVSCGEHYVWTLLNPT